MTDSAQMVLGEDISNVPAQDQGKQPQSYYNNLVGEGKKYSDNEALAKTVQEKEKYIQKLEQEAQVRNSSDSRIDQVLARLDELQAQPSDNNSPLTNDGDSNTEALKPEDVIKVVKDVLKAESEADIAKNNATKALADLSEHYGSKAAALQAIKKVTGEDPKKTKLLNEMGATSPDDFVTLVKSKVEKAGGTNDPAGLLPSGSENARNGFIKWSDAANTLLTDKDKYHSKEYQKLIDASKEYYTSIGIDYFKET
jgi:hypothetical protein